jgi:hypothetical protein
VNETTMPQPMRLHSHAFQMVPIQFLCIPKLNASVFVVKSTKVAA